MKTLLDYIKEDVFDIDNQNIQKEEDIGDNGVIKDMKKDYVVISPKNPTYKILIEPKNVDEFIELSRRYKRKLLFTNTLLIYAKKDIDFKDLKLEVTGRLEIYQYNNKKAKISNLSAISNILEISHQGNYLELDNVQLHTSTVFMSSSAIMPKMNNSELVVNGSIQIIDRHETNNIARALYYDPSQFDKYDIGDLLNLGSVKTPEIYVETDFIREKERDHITKKYKIIPGKHKSKGIVSGNWTICEE